MLYSPYEVDRRFSCSIRLFSFDILSFVTGDFPILNFWIALYYLVCLSLYGFLFGFPGLIGFVFYDVTMRWRYFYVMERIL